MKKRPIRYDPVTGKETNLYIDSDGTWHFQTEVPIQPLIDSNQQQKNEWRYGNLIGNTQKHKQKIAEMPAHLYYELKEKFGSPRDNPKAWRQWLNDPDNAVFKTWGGKL